jgi:hypothetical protein
MVFISSLYDTSLLVIVWMILKVCLATLQHYKVIKLYVLVFAQLNILFRCAIRVLTFSLTCFCFFVNSNCKSLNMFLL